MNTRLPFVLFLILVALVSGGIFFWQPEFAAFLLLGLIAGGVGVLFIRQNRGRGNQFELTGSAKPRNQSKTQFVSSDVLLTTVINSTREGIIVVGADLRLTAANRSAENMFTHIVVPLEGRRLTELIRDMSVHDAFLAATERGEHADIKVEARGGDERRTFDLRVAPLELDAQEDKRRSAIGIFYEITQLERLEKVRQEFLSNVSHELRTPLASILAFVETLENGAINDAENNLRFLSVIRKNSERMHRLINDILELSAIESGKVTVEPSVVRLSSLVEEIKINFAAEAEKRKVTIENQIAPVAAVFADVFRLEQMLTNLIDNAVKFNSEGGRVTISFESDGERDRILVSDTGEGLAPEHAGRIFERFYRVDRARSRSIGGTGLGLAIVKHLARLHGGEASVHSKLGEGSTFIIELPAQNNG